MTLDTILIIVIYLFHLRRLVIEQFMKNRLKNFVITGLCKLLGLSAPNRWSVRISENLQDLSKKIFIGENSLFFIANTWLLKWRVDTINNKEPETIDWIKGFKEDDIFFDVGANVGMYTILGARFSKQVFAFEPESSNYHILNRNIHLNGLAHKIRAYCLAVSNEERFDTLRLTDIRTGSAHHSFSVSKNQYGNEYVPVFEQGSFSTSLDDLIYQKNLPCPNHLKIDVDGLEAQIINGAKRLLTDLRLKSILIELNESLPDDQEILSILNSQGFKVIKKGVPEINLSGTAKMTNHIFVRDL